MMEVFSVTSNVAANGNVVVNGGSTLTGNVQYGGAVSGTITGTKTQIPNSVPIVGLPLTPNLQREQRMSRPLTI